MPLTKKGRKLKKIFEKEYQGKGRTKAEADAIFYAYEAKHGFTRKRK